MPSGKGFVEETGENTSKSRRFGNILFPFVLLIVLEQP